MCFFVEGMETYDVIVVGVGAMGSSTVYHLAKRGLKASYGACVTFVPPLQVLALDLGSLVQLQQLNDGPVPTACCTQVLGLEQFSVAHDKGSSHGLSRIIRLAYHVCSPTVCFGCLLMQPDCLALLSHTAVYGYRGERQLVLPVQSILLPQLLGSNAGRCVICATPAPRV